MHCSFNINNNNESLQLIYNEEKIYIKRDSNKISEETLNSKESFVFKYLIEHSSISNPQSARDVEESFKLHFDEEFSLYALKNIIASIRKKYRSLCKKAKVDNNSELISNLYKVGYFIDLDKSSTNRIAPKYDINQFKPSQFEMLKLMFNTYHRELIKALIAVFTISSFFLFVVYFSQILYTTKIANEYSENTKHIAAEVMDYGCDSHGAVHSLRHSLNLDSVVMTTPYDSCYISKTRSKMIELNQLDDFYDSADFAYSRFMDTEHDIEMVARISKRSIEARYKNSLLPLLVDSISIQKNGYHILNLGEESKSIYQTSLPTGATITFYSDDIVALWIALSLILATLLYRSYILGFVIYLFRWKHISFEEEPIINTEDNCVLYYELLSRVRNVGVLSFINTMRRTNLLTFHTILLIETVRKAKLNNSHEIYGVNVCPSALVGSNFARLREHLAAMEANEFVVEITEYSNIGYGCEVIDNIKDIKKLGITIALDDFGTGNNNIEIINVISPAYLKLDRCFVKDIESGEHHQGVLLNISEIGRLSNITMIYEGVETRRQQYILCQLGYNLHQGYLYSRPNDSKEQ
ncbi:MULTISPECIES: EAL domain-containing protein [Vibrio]|jgi:EAL domain-containing protein (putative c-di-GMP-specific phosphodiesterase class I)|uniref:EAL domain-containing protein n=1 Tax=Vibrio TaxID=662 RepID=UPI0003162808|nr:MULTISPECIES: EAL domain-containing protein [Vibrio]OEF03739.1 diguanylate phosphodiesterase [Vibrio crassostreae 9ZC77]PMK83716.1 diguanylate phosphodiesterase [Vibrio sp. 10N.261.52.E5]TKF79145.1 EAL domain-containing protein [Vibrio sp. F13]TKG03294.1 EAL domain-containing protein [Vibrio sp. F13]